MTRHITQSMFIIINNKTFSRRWKQTENTKSFGIVTVIFMMCVYNDMESVATTGSCVKKGVKGYKATHIQGHNKQFGWQRTQRGESWAPNKNLEINQH